MVAPRRARRPGRRIYYVLTLLLVLAIALGAAIAATAAATSGGASGASYHQRRYIANTDLNPYGANVFLSQEVEDWKLDKTLRMAQEAGIVWLKQLFAWDEIEPEKGRFVVQATGKPTWEKYDKLVDMAEHYGLHLIARLDQPPAWARPTNQQRGPIDNYNDYGDFVYNFVRHFKGRVRYIQIWNEPNLWYEWGGLEPNARDYTALLRLAYRRAKEADPNVYVMSAPLAPTLEASVRAAPDTTYLQQMYDFGARNYFDILSANAFGQDRPPEDPPDNSVLNFQRVVLLRRIMEKNGDADKPVWINEYGWNAAPSDFTADKLTWQRVSEQTQAEYTVRGLQLALREWDWVGVICVWYLRQVGSMKPDSAEYYFRMVDTDFTPRLVYRALKGETSQPAAGAGYFDETTPSVRAGPGWQYEIANQASGGQVLVTDKSGGSTSFAFQGTGLDIVSAREPGAGMLWVTIDGQPANGLPRDKSGHAYIDLSSPTSRWQVQTPVATNLLPGQHLVQVEAAQPGGRVTVDAFVVQNKPTARLPILALGMGFVTLGIAVTLGLLWRERRQRAG